MQKKYPSEWRGKVQCRKETRGVFFLDTQTKKQKNLPFFIVTSKKTRGVFFLDTQTRTRLD